jgi:hemolysin activation/secretion protein
MRTTIATAAATLLIATAGNAAGQAVPAPVTPGAAQRQTEQTQEYYELQRRLEQPPPSEEVIRDQAAPPAAPPPGAEQVRIFVRQIETDTSEVLGAEEVRDLLHEYENREVTLAELFDAVKALNALYAKRGCPTCQAFLPPQKVQEGVVRIRLVEGRVGSVQIEGNRYTDARYLENRVGLKSGQLFSVTELERHLYRLNATTELEAAAELKPGAQFGTIDTVVRVQEPPRADGLLFTDNAGREETGEYRLGGLVNLRSIFGLADRLSLTAVGTQGSGAASAAFVLPVHRSGTWIGLNADYSTIDIIDGPFEPLEVSGEAYNVGAIVTQPLRTDPRWRVQAFAGYNDRTSITKFGGVPITRTDAAVFSLGAEAQHFFPGGVWYTRQTLWQAVDALGGDRDYFKYTGDFTLAHALPRRMQVLLRSAWQISADDLLPSFDQFLIGGTATVRGYTEGLLSGDDGYFLSAELQFPLLGRPAGAESGPTPELLRGLVFLDNGAAFPYRGGRGTSSDDFLTSIGAGVIFDVSRYLSGRLMVGVPLSEPGIEVDDVRVHFYVQSRVF